MGVLKKQNFEHLGTLDDTSMHQYREGSSSNQAIKIDSQATLVSQSLRMNGKNANASA
ncbi:hypothetical protein Tco_0734874, partial [Tanacetum coccineum]